MNHYQPQIQRKSILSCLLRTGFMAGAYIILINFSGRWFEQKLNIGNFSITFHSLFLAYLSFYICFQINNIFKHIFWKYYLPKQHQIHLSDLLLGIINCSIYLTCIFFISSNVLGFNIQSALAATGAVGVVLGFGLQRVVLDLFVGISLDMSKAMKIGDFIHLKHGGQDVSGAVIQMNWRVVTLQSSDNTIYQIPNNILGSCVLTNFSRPSPESEFELVYIIPAIYKETLIIETIQTALETLSCLNLLWDYKCRIRKVTHEGIAYKVCYTSNPAMMGPGKLRHMIHSRVFRFLRAANIHFSTSRLYDIPHAAPESEFSTIAHVPTCNLRQLLAHVDIFESINPEELTGLSQQVMLQTFNRGEIICKQGDTGDSLFIIKNGYCKVWLEQPEQQSTNVAVLVPEDFFGEMSLLSGEPRSATVTAESKVIVYELPAIALKPLFENNSEFYKILAKIIADRESKNAQLLKKVEDPVVKISRLRELEQKFLNFSKKILTIFK